MRTKTTLIALATVLCPGMLPNLAHAQAAPVLNLTSYTRLSPDTKTGLGATVAFFNNKIYLAMKGDGNNYLWISTSTNGVNVSSTEYTSIVLNYAPALAVFNNKLYVAYTTQSGSISEISSSDGVTWSSPGTVYFPSLLDATGPPTLVVYNNNLYAYWEEDYTNVVPQNRIDAAVMDTDGTWSAESLCTYDGTTSTSSPTSHSAVGAAVFNSELYLGIQLGNSTTANTLLVCRSNGFTNHPFIHPEGGISASVFGSSLYFAYKSNSSSNYLEITGTSDGSTFTTPGTQYTGLQINGTTGYEIAPALLPYQFQLWVFYTANDNTHYLYEAHSH